MTVVPPECVQNTQIDVCRTRSGWFVGAAVMFGRRDLPFVDRDTEVLTIEKNVTENALLVRITRERKT